MNTQEITSSKQNRELYNVMQYMHTADHTENGHPHNNLYIRVCGQASIGQGQFGCNFGASMSILC